MTFTLSAPVVAAEGTLYSFDITPTEALAVATTIRWQIVPKGALPVTSSDFPSLTGMLSFTSGATTAQTVTFTPTDDARREISKDFELRIYDTADDSTPLDTQVVTLRDNDDATGTYGNDILTGNGDANIIGFGTTHAVTANGSAGSDFYVISRFQYGNVEITDTVGTNLVKFDAGVTITDYDEESADGFVKVISRVDLTLSTGAVITIINPVGKFVFQLGSDPIITTYDEFKGEIRAEGSNETSTLRNNEAFQVLTATTDPDISGNSLPAQFSPSFGSASVDVFSSASTSGFSQNGSAGDDFYVISRFQYGNVEITDTVGTNLIKFDVGVTITDYDEESADGFVKVISRVALTLSTGAVITIINPVGKFVFQLGDDDVIATYAEFKGEIRAEGSNETSTLRNNEAFPIPFPSEEPAPTAASDAVFDPLPSLTLTGLQDGRAEAIIIGTVTASDADDDPIAYTLDGAPSGFAIGETSGEITYAGRGISYTRTPSITFDVIATSTGADGTDTAIREEVSIRIAEPPRVGADAVFVDVPTDFTLVEGHDGSTTPIVIGSVRATDADGDTVAYRLRVDFAGEDTTGFEIDANGQITYVGTGLTYADSPTARFTAVATSTGVYGTQTDVLHDVIIDIVENAAPTIDHSIATAVPDTEPTNIASLAVITSDVTSYPPDGSLFSDEREQLNFSNLVDGVTTVPLWGFDGEGYSPRDADGKFLSFRFEDDDYTQGSVLLYIRGGRTTTDIDNSMLEFRLDGIVVGTPTTLLSANADSKRIITVTPDADLVFDEVRVIFSGDDQNFKEVEIFGRTTELVFDSFANQDAVTTLSAFDTTPNGLAWSLEDANSPTADARLFDINEDTGEITWKTAPDFATTVSTSDNKEFTVTAIATDGSGATDRITLTVTLLENTAPVFDGPAITNIAPMAALSTTITNFFGRTSEEDIAQRIGYLTDGRFPDAASFSSSNAFFTNFANGRSVTFDFEGDTYSQATVRVYNRIEDRVGRDDRVERYIDHSRLDFLRDGEVVYTKLLQSSTQDARNIITVAAMEIVFDAVRITFNGNNQNLAEVEIDARELTPIVSVENQQEAGTLSAVDAEGDSVTWALTGGDDVALFDINSETGEIRWKTAPDYDTLNSAAGTKLFSLIVTVTDGSNAEIVHRIVRLADVDDVAPIFANRIIEGFTGHANLYANGVDASDGIFHYSGTIPRGAPSMTNIPDLVAYLPDGSIVNIPAQNNFSFTYNSAFNFAYLWIEQAGDGTWVLATSPDLTLPTHGRPFYTLGVYNSDARFFFYPYANLGGLLTSVGEFVRDEQLIIPLDDTLAVDSGENQNAVITLVAADVDTAAADLVWSLSGAYAHLFEVSSSGVVTWATAPDYETLYNDAGGKDFGVTVTVSNESTIGLLSDSIDLTVTLTDADGPVITQGDSLALEVSDGQQAVTTLTAIDEETAAAGSYTWTLTGDDATLFEVSNSGVVTWATAPDFDALDSDDGDKVFTFTATVSNGDSTTPLTDSIVLAITLVDGANPVIGEGAVLAVDSRENQDAVATLTATAAGSVTWSLHGDNIALIDANPLLEATGDADLFEIDSATGVITWASAPDFETASSDRGTKEFTFAARASDGTNTDTTIVTVTLTDEDASTGVYFIPTGGSQVFGVNAAGTPAASLDALVFTSGTATVVGTYGDFTLSLNGNTVNWVYALDDTRAAAQALGVDEIAHETFRLQSVVDGVAGEIQTFEADVVGVNDAPTIANTAVTVRVAAGASFTIQSLASLIGYADADGTVADPDSGQDFFRYAVLNLDGLDDIEGEFSYSFRGLDRAFTESTSILTYLRTNPSNMKFQADGDAAGSSFTFSLTVGDEIDGRTERSEPISVTVEIAAAAGAGGTTSSTSTVGSSVTTLMSGDGTAADNLDAHDAPNGLTIQGGALADVIIGTAHGDIIAGGYGDDSITLGDGADKVVYRWESGASSTATDGGDTVTGFARGVDQLVLIDVDTASPITSFKGFIDYAKGTDTVAGSADDLVTFAFTDDSADALTSLEIIFANAGTTDGSTAGGADSNRLTITFENAIDVATQQAIFRTPDTTDLSAILVEEGGKLVLQSKYGTIDDILGKTDTFESVIFDDDTTSLGFDII